MMSKLGVKYDEDSIARTWFMDLDYSVHKVRKVRLDLGKNIYNETNLAVSIFENREWNPSKNKWEPDGRFVLDFLWPLNSDCYLFNRPKTKQDRHTKTITKVKRDGTRYLAPYEPSSIKECSFDAKDLKKLADFICDFAKTKSNNWGVVDSNQTISKNKNSFNIKYAFNYYIDDRYKRTESIDFDFEIKKFDFGDEFKSLSIKTSEFFSSKEIDELVGVIMTPLQLKEFANFIYNSIEEFHR